MISPNRLLRLIPFLILALPQKSLAATQLVNSSDYFYTKEVIDATNVRIYAGSTFNQVQPTDNVTTPGNSCTSSSFAALPISRFFSTGDKIVCSDCEIYPQLLFSVTIQSDKGETYLSTCSTPLLAKVDGTPITIKTLEPATYTPNVPNQSLTAYIEWGTMCNAAGAGSCTRSDKWNLTVGFAATCGNNDDFSSDGTVKFEISYRRVDDSPAATFGCAEGAVQPYEGFCIFKVFPGDEKVYLSELTPNLGQGLVVPDLQSGSSGADESGIIYKAARLFFVQGNQTDLLVEGLGATSVADFEYSLTGGLKKDFIGGLTNGLQYSFIMGSVDQAGIVSFFTNPNVAGMNFLTTPIGETQSTIPEPVSGLLDGKKCFIATAAFGSEMAPEVESFRNFRDQVLLKNSVGLWLVGKYYTWSPHVAQVIQDSSVLRTWVRSQLWLLLLLVEIILKIGMWPSILISSASLFLFYRQVVRTS